MQALIDYCHLLSFIAMLLPCYCHWLECCNATMQAGFKGLLAILSFNYAYEYKSICITARRKWLRFIWRGNIANMTNKFSPRKMQTA